ncbi:roadblock/LC7 domain-containing protein [Streptomyces paradoxus]|uniref:roadblock/LC7 domain-containing protein n=1 Tax=Streptomyces paradoxus TaxID=66375 RepID=UPI0037CE2791
MAAEADVLDELHSLRARLPQLTGALAASADGFVLAQDIRGAEPEGLAALTATAQGVALRLTDATGQGDFRELLVRGAHGYVATYAAGPSAVLTLVAGGRVNVGRLHLEGRRSGNRIGELLRAAVQQPDRTPAPPPPTTGGPLPVRTPSPRADGTRDRAPRAAPGEASAT